jgi:predicted ABC-type ATPase
LTQTILLEVLQRALQRECPALIVLAGSNGAGKTTFYELYLERLGLPFVNADRIARALNPAHPEQVAYQAADVADDVRRDLMKRGLSFCMESPAWRRILMQHVTGRNWAAGPIHYQR